MNVLMNFSIRRVESKFNIFVSDGHQLVWRRVGITLEGYNTESTFKHGSGVSWCPKGQDCYMYLEMLRQHIPASVAILGWENVQKTQSFSLRKESSVISKRLFPIHLRA